jgi:hypothetical protein
MFKPDPNNRQVTNTIIALVKTFEQDPEFDGTPWREVLAAIIDSAFAEAGFPYRLHLEVEPAAETTPLH